MAVTSQQMVDAYIAAEQAILAGKSYSLAGRTVTMEDLNMVRAGRKEWERRVAEEQLAAIQAGSGLTHPHQQTPLAAIATSNQQAVGFEGVQSGRFWNRN